GLAADPATMKVFFLTGNGAYRKSQSSGANPAGPLGADSVESAFVVLDALTLGIVAKWHPPNFTMLQQADMDLGSGGVLLLPSGPEGAGRLVGGGKNGVFYVLRRDLKSVIAGSTGPMQAWQAFMNIHLPTRPPKQVACTPRSIVLCPTAWDGDMFAAPNIHG